MPRTQETLGQRLRRVRLAAGLTQRQVAEGAGLSARQVRNLEAGTDTPRVDTVLRLAHALGCRPGELVPEIWRA